LASSCN